MRNIVLLGNNLLLYWPDMNMLAPALPLGLVASDPTADDTAVSNSAVSNSTGDPKIAVNESTPVVEVAGTASMETLKVPTLVPSQKKRTKAPELTAEQIAERAAAIALENKIQEARAARNAKKALANAQIDARNLLRETTFKDFVDTLQTVFKNSNVKTRCFTDRAMLADFVEGGSLQQLGYILKKIFKFETKPLLRIIFRPGLGQIKIEADSTGERILRSAQNLLDILQSKASDYTVYLNSKSLQSR